MGKPMTVGRSIDRDAEKNFKRGWSLIAVTMEPALYLNVQVDGAAFAQIQLGSKRSLKRIGEMIAHLPISLNVQHEAYARSEKQVWNGREFLSEDRDLWRVQLPTPSALVMLEQINGLLPAGDRFEVYRGVGLTRKDYTQKATIKMGNNGDLVVDGGYGRYAVLPEVGGLHLFELHRRVPSLDGEPGENGLGLLLEAMDWVTYEPFAE